MDNSYAPHCAIVQSTGTGKSKTVDEFSKYDFVMPVNLRKPEATGACPSLSLSNSALTCGASGFPASDKQVYRYLHSAILNDMTPDSLRRRMDAFMFALLTKCNEVIKEAPKLQKKGWLRASGAAWFRDKMTTGQTMECQGPYRVAFYDDVITKAIRVSGNLLCPERVY